MNRLNLILAGLLAFFSAKAQSYKIPEYFDNPVVVDSSSTVLLPVLYNESIFSSNGLKFWGDYYANIIVYNFKTDSSRKLFDKDTYIAGFNENYYYGHTRLNKNMTSSLIFYKVHNVDFNKNEKIDETDPAILYVSDIHGNNLKPLSTENENALSIEIFEKQNSAIVKFQRDSDNNKKYNNDDKDYFYVKLDLTTLKFGNRIELR